MNRSLHLFFLLAAAALLWHCGDGKEPMPDIQGRWRSMTWNHPDWLYDFQDGILTQSIDTFGVTITALRYPYALRGDTLIIGGDLNNAPRRWLLHFECSSVVHVRDMDAALNLVQYLRRTD